MSFHNEREFELLASALGEQILDNAAKFAREQGLNGFCRGALKQMSVPFSVVAHELLMFGCDAWPDSAQDERTTPLMSDIAA